MSVLLIDKANLLKIVVLTGFTFSCFGTFVPYSHANSLNDALRTGIENSNELAASRQAYLSAKQEVVIAGSSKDLAGTFSLSESQTAYDRNNDDRNSYSVSTLTGAITLSKQLYDFGETTSKKEAAFLALQIAEAEYYVAEQSTVMAIITAYLNVIQSKEEVALHQSNFDRLEKQTKAEELRVEAGVSTIANLALIRSQELRAHSDLISSKAAFENATEEYKSLIGFSPVALTTPELPALIPLKIKASETRAYENHPSITLAAASEKIADIQQDILIKSLGPTVDFSVTAKSQNTAGISTTDGNEVAANLAFSVPILATSSAKAKSQQLISDSLAARYDRDEIYRSIGLAARAGFRNHISAKIQFKASKSEVDAYQLVVDAITTEVEFGNKTFLDQLDAEDDLKNAKLRKLQANHLVLLTGFQLLQAIGELTVENLGVGDVLPELQELDSPEPEFNSIISVINK